MADLDSETQDSSSGTDSSEDVSDAYSYLYMPSVVDHVHIEGLKRTKSEFLVPELQRILDATTFGEVVAFSLQARELLNSLDIFKSVDVYIDTSQGPKASPNGFDVTLTVKEKRLVTSNVGTQVGNNEGSMIFGAKLNNVFGKAEGLKADLGFGTKTKSSYQLLYTKPVSLDPRKSFQIGAQKVTIDFPTSSHKELTRGVSLSYTLPSNLGLHTFGCEGMWRELTGLYPKASFSVRRNAGHSLKSSLTHVLLSDTRDHPSFPTEGGLFKLTQELAGLGGDVKFFKNNIETQKNLEIQDDVVLSCSLQCGIMNTPPNTTTRINDRFFLGGPLSVRGFQMKGIGPRERSISDQQPEERFWSVHSAIVSKVDSLGAEAYWSVGLHLYTPLPFRPAQGSIGDHIKTHLFINAGNLVPIDSSLPWKQQLHPLVQDTRWSCGVGLVLLVGIARLELNYCLPGGYQLHDRVNRGLQFGLGVHFL